MTSTFKNYNFRNKQQNVFMNNSPHLKPSFLSASLASYSMGNQNAHKQKQNNFLASNYSSYNPTSSSNQVPKQILEKTVQLKDQHISDLMEELKQTKSAYEEFKVKFSLEMAKIKEENSAMKQRIQPLVKQKQSYRKHLTQMEHQKQHILKQHKLSQNQNISKISLLNKHLQQMQEQNTKLKKLISNNQKQLTQTTKQKEQILNKFVKTQNQLNTLKGKQSNELSKMKDKLEKLQTQNQQLLREIEKNRDGKRQGKKYDRKLERLEDKIVGIIANI